jgi:drug/metabolite transporter (DMT)-like permease
MGGGSHGHHHGRRVIWGFSLAAGSAICYAFLPILAKAAYSFGASPEGLLSLRFFFAVPLFWAFSLAFRRDRIFVGWKKGILFFCVGFFFFGLASLAVFQAFEYIEASLTIILLYTYPPLVAIWGRVIAGEKLSWIKIASLAAAFSGVILMVGSSTMDMEGAVLTGVLLVLAASVGYSLFSFFAQRVVADTPPLIFTTYLVTAAFVMVAIVEQPLPLLYRSSPAELVLAAAMALFSTFFSIYFFVKSIQYIGATRASIVSNLEPAGATLLAYVILGERLNPIQITGGIFILAGVYLLVLEARRSPERSPPGGRAVPG